MAGQTTNTDILAGMNQVIQAINDLVLSSTCTPAITVNNAACGCGGTDPPSDPGGEGDPPPEGWDDTDDEVGSPGYLDRKCNVANMSFDDFIAALQRLDELNMPVVIETGVVGAIEIVTLSLIALIVGPLSLSIAVVGAVIAIVTVFLASTVDLPGLITIFNTNKNDIICTFYNSTDPIVAIDDFKTILTDGGANVAQVLVVDALISVAATNALYHKYIADGGALEVRVAAYTGGIDCSVCDTCPDYFLFWGNVTDFTQTHLEMDSEWNGSYHVCSLAFHVSASPWPDNVCGPECEFTVVSLVGRTAALGVTDFKIRDENNVSVWDSETEPTVVENTLYFIFYSATAYTLVADLVFEV